MSMIYSHRARETFFLNRREITRFQATELAMWHARSINASYTDALRFRDLGTEANPSICGAGKMWRTVANPL